MEVEEQGMEEMMTQVCVKNKEYLTGEIEKQEMEAEEQDDEEMMTRKRVKNSECLGAGERQDIESREQDKEEMMTRICVKNDKCLGAGKRQDMESGEQDEEETMTQICVKNDECLGAGKRQDMESREQDKEEMMTQICVKNDKYLGAGKRQDMESGEQDEEETMTQICVKNDECLGAGKRQDMESREQDKEEMMTQICVKNDECVGAGKRQDMESGEQDGEEMMTQICVKNDECVGAGKRQDMESGEQDGEEMMTQICVKNDKCLGAGERQDMESGEQDGEEMITQICVKNDECLGARERQDVESREQDKEEGMIQMCVGNVECLGSEGEKQDMLQNSEDDVQNSDHIPVASEFPKGIRSKENTIEESTNGVLKNNENITEESINESVRSKEDTIEGSGCEETSEAPEPKVETGKKRKKESKSFPCDKCSHVSHSSANLKKHMMTHTGERPYMCQLCRKSFRQRNHLADHWRVHSGERPFECELCDSRFIQKSSLNLHKKRHFGVKSFSCTECNYATYEKVHLTAHMRTHTGEKPYQCEECGQTFSTATRLKYHRMIHTGERRYKCHKCGVPFREKVTLQTHMAVHLKLGPFECEECGQEFSRLASLSLHRKVHNNKDNYLYVHDKEANQSFRSALEKASHDKMAQVTQPSEESKKTPGSESDWETELDHTDIPSSPGTPEQPASSEEKCKERGTPTTPPRLPLGPASCLSPEASSPSLSKISSSPETDSQHRLKENLASNLKYSFEPSGSNIDPEQVREALENGTILETQGDDGKGFFIVLPPALKNKDIVVLADSPQSSTAISSISDSSLTLKDRDSAFEGNLSPNILSENVLESHGALYPGVVEEVHECDMDSVGLEEEICSEVEGDMIHPCEAESIECIFNTNCHEEVLEPLGGYSEAIEEHLSPDGTSLMLWKDNSVNQLGNVTYIIEAGKKEPIVIHTQDDLSSLVPSVKGKRQRCKGSGHVLEGSEGSNLELGDCVKIRISSRKGKIKKQRSQRVYNCEQCGKPCKNSSNYIAHLRTHSGERPYFCALCRTGFKQISHLRSHIRVHTGERPYVCDLCDAAFTQSSRLNSHKRNVHANGQTEVKKKKEKYTPGNRIKNFFCRHCNKTYIGECLKVDHMKTHRHSLQYRCEVCGMQFKNKTSLLSHSMKHTDSMHVCEVCGTEVASLQDLSRHRAMLHSRSMPGSNLVDTYINVKIGEESDFIVLNPAMKDNSSDLLEIEMKSEGDDEAEGSLCEVKQEVIHLTDINGSVKSEVEVMSAQVEVKEEEMAVHDITHTSPQKDKDHIEQQQQQEEEESSSLLANSQKETPGSVEDDVDAAKEREMKDKQFITYVDEVGKKVWLCKVCDRSFGQSSNLYCHLRMHTGDKPYHCNVCPRAFRQISHLKDHMRRHTGAKPHRCSRCRKCFSQRSAVRRHIRVLHGGDAVALREPESGLTKEIIDTLSDECGLVSRGVKMGDSQASTDRLLENDEQLCKLPHKENIPHACRVCQKQFSQVSSFNAHTRKCRKLQTPQKVAAADNRSCEWGKSFAAQLLRHQEGCSLVQDDNDLENKTKKISGSGEECESDLKKSHCENTGDTENKKSRHKPAKAASINTLVTQNQFKCKECGEVLHGMTSYKAHLQAHGEELQQVCVVCGEAFKRASALRYHQSMKHGRQDRRYKDFCSIGYATVQEDDPEEDSVTVKVETESEESLSITDEDEREEEYGGREPYTRVKPRKTYLKRKSRQDLKRTRRDALKTTSNTTQKDIENDKEFNESSGENLESKSYVCSVCGMTFTRSSKLRHHTAMWCRGRHSTRNNTNRRQPHTERTPVKVSKVARKPENQRSKSAGNSPVACSTPDSLSERLVSKSDGDVPATSAVVKEGSVKQSSPALYCKTCDTCFPDKDSCDKHVCSPASEKPFRCEHCLLRFRRKAHLFNHYRRHTREASLEDL